MKILINKPSFRLLGGVANHYMGLQPYWSETVLYNTVGSRSWISGIFLLPFDVVKFIVRLWLFHPNIVLLNPSLAEKAMRRDMLFLRLSKVFGVKVALFFHGFNRQYAGVLNKEKYVPLLNQADVIFVLANEFRELFLSWGVKTQIELTTTKVDDRLIANLSADNEPLRTSPPTLLFLARVHRDKGIFEAIEAFCILKEEFPEIRLRVVGEGPDLQKAKKMVESLGVLDVIFEGCLIGDELVRSFENSDLYLLPSRHEGMPTSVLEAMAFGLPVFVTKVGGIPDFFEQGKMGVMIEENTPQTFAQEIREFLIDKSRMISVSEYNKKYARTHFMASVVVKGIEEKLRNTIGYENE